MKWRQMPSFLPFSLTSTYYFRHKLSLLLPPVVTVLYEPRDRKIRRRSQNEFAVLGKEARNMRAFQKKKTRRLPEVLRYRLCWKWTFPKKILAFLFLFLCFSISVSRRASRHCLFPSLCLSFFPLHFCSHSRPDTNCTRRLKRSRSIPRKYERQIEICPATLPRLISSGLFLVDRNIVILC